MFHAPFMGWNSPAHDLTLVRSAHPQIDTLATRHAGCEHRMRDGLTARSGSEPRKDLHESPFSCDPSRSRPLAHRSPGPDASLARPLRSLLCSRLILQLHRPQCVRCRRRSAFRRRRRALPGQFAPPLRPRRRFENRPCGLRLRCRHSLVAAAPQPARRGLLHHLHTRHHHPGQPQHQRDH